MLKNDKATTAPTNQCPVTFLSVLRNLQKKDKHFAHLEKCFNKNNDRAQTGTK